MSSEPPAAEKVKENKMLSSLSHARTQLHRQTPTTSKRLSDARATLWTEVDQGGSPARVALLGSDDWARLGRLGVETARSRAYI